MGKGAVSASPGQGADQMVYEEGGERPAQTQQTVE